MAKKPQKLPLDSTPTEGLSRDEFHDHVLNKLYEVSKVPPANGLSPKWAAIILGFISALGAITALIYYPATKGVRTEEKIIDVKEEIVEIKGAAKEHERKAEKVFEGIQIELQTILGSVLVNQIENRAGNVREAREQLKKVEKKIEKSNGDNPL